MQKNCNNNNNCGNKNNGSVIEDKSWRRSKHLEVFPNYSISKGKNKLKLK